jgi:hypothetical protein
MRELFIQAFQSVVPDIKKLVFIVYDPVVPQLVRESVRTITTELPSLYISVLLFGINMQIYVASKIMSLLLICSNSDTLKNPHNLIGQPSPTDTYLVKNVLEGAKRKLATPTVKKEPINSL